MAATPEAAPAAKDRKQPAERVEEEESTPKKRQVPKPAATPMVVDDDKPKARKGAKRIPASKVVLEGVPLYRGHTGPGIGYLQADLPDRRDADRDTVVGERKPHKDDEYKLSPLAPLAAAAKRSPRRKSGQGIRTRSKL